MKTPIAIAFVALASLTANAASAYHFAPPKTSVRLHGKLTFTPDEGGHPFTCSVTMDLKTTPQHITTVKFPQGESGCEDVHFLELPWNVAIADANSGVIQGGVFTSGSGTCSEGVNTFQDNGSGIWTVSGGCLSGTLTSHPPTIIVP